MFLVNQNLLIYVNYYIICSRHHHETGLMRHKCNHNIENFHDNICVSIVNSDISRYMLNQEEVLDIVMHEES